VCVCGCTCGWQVRGDAAELEELRELRSDVERREKAQAGVIENQARRLEELEKLYKEEVLQRKRVFNAMEDMKVRAPRAGRRSACCG
jgi:hypothetical protein